jgi:hypothetical protein
MRVYNHENRLSIDNCAQLTKELQNKSVNDRQMFNFYYTHDCKCDVLDEFLFDNNMVVKDGYGVTTGCTVDTDSELRLNSMWTNEREKSQLCTRWHQGVPNLNKGGLVPNVETKIKNGDDTSDIRNCDKITERDFNRFTPLVGCLASTIQNPEHVVEPWIRGGMHTRNEVRSNGYLEKCGFMNNGKNWVRKEAV